MVEIAAANIVEFLATLTFSGFSLFLFLTGWILKLAYSHRLFKRSIRESVMFRRYEDCLMVWITWFGSCAVSAVLLSIFFAEIYESFDSIDSSIVVLTLFVVFQLLFFLWFISAFVWAFHESASMFFPYFFLVIATITAIINTILVLMTLKNSGSDGEWTHYLVLFLYLPCLTGFFATNTVHTHREFIVNEKTTVRTTISDGVRGSFRWN